MRSHVQASKKLFLFGKKGRKSKILLDTNYKKRILQRDEEEDEVDLENYNNDQLLPTCSICGKIMKWQISIILALSFEEIVERKGLREIENGLMEINGGLCENNWWIWRTL